MKKNLDLSQAGSATEKLSTEQKHFFFFLWLPFVTAALKKDFIKDLSSNKLKQAKYYSLSGFISFTLSAYLTIAFSLNNSVYFIILLAGLAITSLLENFFSKNQWIKK